MRVLSRCLRHWGWPVDGEVRAELQARLIRKVDVADLGEQLPRTAAALALSDPVARLEALVEALGVERVLVAATVRPGGEQPHLGDDPCHEVASVATTSGAALAAFTSLAALLVALPHARPVPVSGREAARLAIANFGGKLVVDPVGSSGVNGNDTGGTELVRSVRLPRPALVALADGSTWLPAWKDRELAEYLKGLSQAPIVFLRCLPSAQARQPIRVGVVPGATRRQIGEKLALLAADSRLLAACEQIELQPTPVEFA